MFKTSRFSLLFLVVSLVAFFIPLLVLPFFNHAFADDYVTGIHLRNEGFLHYQYDTYMGWGGRYTGTLLGSLFVINSFLYSHYYLHSILLLVLNIASVYFLLSQFFLHVLKERRSFIYLLCCSLFLVAAEYIACTEISTYLFWFISAITYQTPIILLKLELALWLFAFYAEKPFYKRVAGCMIVLLIIVINGCNELFIVAQFFLITTLFLTGVFRNSKSFFWVAVMPAFVISAAFALLAPGNSSRGSLMESKSISTGIAVTLFQVGEALWSIGKNPVFWISLTSVYFFADQRREIFISSVFFQKISRKPSLLLLYILLFLLSSVGFAVVGLKGGLIPDRYVNAVIAITLYLFLFFAFVAGLSAKQQDVVTGKNYLQILFCLLLSLGLFANDFFKEGWLSLLSAPVYNKVMSERESILQQSAGRDTVYLNNYDSAAQKIVSDSYNVGSSTVSCWLVTKPSFLFYTDDLEDTYHREMLTDFYHVKTIVVK